MSDDFPKGPVLAISEDQAVLHESIARIIKPTEEQIEAYRKFADEIGIPDTLDGLDD